MSSIKIHNTLSELYKIFYSRSTKIVLPILYSKEHFDNGKAVH